MNSIVNRLVIAAIPFVAGCCSPNPRTAQKRHGQALKAAAESVWNARLRSSKCRRPPTYATSKWPLFLIAKRKATIRVPTFLPQEPYQASKELANAGGRKEFPPYASQWIGSQGGFAQFSASALDSVKLAYPGPPEPDESICLEEIDGAQATILDSNRDAAPKPGDSMQGSARGSTDIRSSADTMAPPGPYTVFATMRFADGLAVQVYGFAKTAEQKNEMLAAIRTIRRVPKP